MVFTYGLIVILLIIKFVII